MTTNVPFEGDQLTHCVAMTGSNGTRCYAPVAPGGDKRTHGAYCSKLRCHLTHPRKQTNSSARSFQRVVQAWERDELEDELHALYYQLKRDPQKEWMRERKKRERTAPVNERESDACSTPKRKSDEQSLPTIIEHLRFHLDVPEGTIKDVVRTSCDRLDVPFTGALVLDARTCWREIYGEG